MTAGNTVNGLQPTVFLGRATVKVYLCFQSLAPVHEAKCVFKNTQREMSYHVKIINIYSLRTSDKLILMCFS